MGKYIKEYIEEIDKVIASKKVTKEIISNHLVKIGFFQHERLIHLIVTLFYAFMFIVFSMFGTISYIFLIISAILLVFLICYIIHYFKLENYTQYLYKQYDKLKKEIKQ